MNEMEQFAAILALEMSVDIRSDVFIAALKRHHPGFTGVVEAVGNIGDGKGGFTVTLDPYLFGVRNESKLRRADQKRPVELRQFLHS